jgi:hypothetical protein
MARRRRRGDRFPLLIYAPLWKRWGNLGILAAVITLLLWIMAPSVLLPPFDRGPLRHVILLGVLAGGAMFLYGYAARKFAHVRCFSGYVRIQTPIYPLTVAYKRVEGTRLVQVAKVFDPESEKTALKTWPEAYWGMTAVSLDLKSYPLSEQWLRLWLSKYLFTQDKKGFVFLVEDWMTFSRQLNGFISAYRSRRGR